MPTCDAVTTEGSLGVKDTRTLRATDSRHRRDAWDAVEHEPLLTVGAWVVVEARKRMTSGGRRNHARNCIDVARVALSHVLVLQVAGDPIARRYDTAATDVANEYVRKLAVIDVAEKVGHGSAREIRKQFDPMRAERDSQSDAEFRWDSVDDRSNFGRIGQRHPTDCVATPMPRRINPKPNTHSAPAGE